MNCFDAEASKTGTGHHRRRRRKWPPTFNRRFNPSKLQKEDQDEDGKINWTKIEMFVRWTTEIIVLKLCITGWSSSAAGFQNA